MTLAELAELCEQATGPDREIDKAIAWGGARIRDEDLAPRYTASFDAALKLVPKPWLLDYAQQLLDEGYSTAGVYRRYEHANGVTREAGHGQTLALALCAAALRARVAQAIEAQRAETENTGSVHESAVPKGCAQ